MARDKIFPLIDRRTIFDIGTKTRFYRGSSLKSINNDEFENNNIDGTPIVVYEYTGFDPMSIEHPAKITQLDDIPGRLVNREVRWVTGGISKNLGTSVFFQAQDDNYGLTLIMDESRLPENLIEVQYDESFFNKYPAIGTFIATHQNIAITVDGEFAGMGYLRDLANMDYWDGDFSTIDEKKITISRWEGRRGPKVLESLVGIPYVEEEEVVALSPSIDLDASMIGIGSYIGLGAHPHNIDRVARKQLGWDEYHNEFKYEPLETKAQILYEDIQSKMVANQNKLAVIFLKSINTVDKDHNYVTRDNFELLYDGHKIITDYKYASPFV